MTDPIVFRVPDPQNPKEFSIVRFEWATDKNDLESDKAGIPIFDTILLAYISAPGMTRSEATKVCERKLNDGTVIPNKDAVLRFGPQIDAFKRGEATPDMVGTPLAELAGLDSSLRASLKAMNIHTVEALASLADNVQLMGFHKYKTMAQAYMDQINGQKPLLKMAAEIAAKDEKIGRLEKDVQDLAGRLAKLEEPAEEKSARRKAA